ncbi:GNAT family N-acetyltransferase [Devosia submarina]|uniref:GNAT family N-acetyltransferase n=1 Tax=Devosia submarina TaxID=1173082 RepID=UPI000D3DA2C2|nr:GNAT family N-acetyltransferase [Devosia submarina]
MVNLRAVRPDDLPMLYQICLVTGAAGQDASRLHNDPDLIGHIYAAPYAVLEPAQALVAEDEQGVAGYLVGTFDTDRFAEQLEQHWWPALRERYADPTRKLTEADRARVESIMQPERNPADLVETYPAHIHMNLLPRLRGKGIGRALVQKWVVQARGAEVRGIHLGASAGNAGGIAFWQKVGFTPVKRTDRTAWFGMALA